MAIGFLVRRLGMEMHGEHMIKWEGMVKARGTGESILADINYGKAVLDD